MSARFDAVGAQGGKDLAELNMLGDLYARAGDSEEAAKYFEQVGRAYREANFVEKAVAVYKKLARLDPTNVEAQFAVAELSLALRRRSDARGAYDRAIALNRFAMTSKRALTLLRGICSLDPSDTASWLELAERASRGGLPYEAHYGYAAAGRELLRRGETEAAYAAYEAALAHHPLSSEALAVLSERLLDGGRADEAVEMVRSASDRDPHDAALLALLGRTCRRVSRLDEAVGAYTRLVELCPDEAQHLLDVGSRLASAGEIDGALGVASSALERAAGSARTREQVAGLLRQIAAADPGRDEALERLADLCAGSGDAAGETSALARLADRAAARDDRPRAVALLRRLVLLAPNDETYRSHLATLEPSEALSACSTQESPFELTIEVEAPPSAVVLSDVLVVRSADRCLEAEWRRAARTSAALSLLRIRADESAGAALDEALERPGDLLASCGAGEFVALLPGTFREGAEVVAKRMCDRVAPATIRIGIAATVATCHGTPDALVRAAERALASACGTGERQAIVME
jgi:tetratricopeptide (TPR) repeat protein